MDLTNQKVSGTNVVNLQDSLNAAVLSLKIKLGATSVVPEGNDLIIYVDKQTQSNPSSERMKYVFNLSSSLKMVNETSDEFIQEIEIKNNSTNLRAYVKRNIGTNSSGDYILTESTIEEVDTSDVTLFEGINYIYTNYTNAEITMIYPKNDDFNKLFVNSSIYNRNNELNNNFGLDDIYFKDSFTKSGDEINEEIDNIEVKCITSKTGKFSIDKDGNITANSITTNSSNELDKKEIINFIYPIGSIYMSVNSTDPATIIGGVWEQIKGRFLLGEGQNESNTTDYWGSYPKNTCNFPLGETSGEVRHSLTVNEMPSHSHGIPSLSGSTSGAGSHNHAVIGTSANYGGSGAFCETWANRSNDRNGYTSSVGDHTHSVTTNASNTNNSGGSQEHNNMPPYLVVKIWKRVS